MERRRALQIRCWPSRMRSASSAHYYMQARTGRIASSDASRCSGWLKRSCRALTQAHRDSPTPRNSSQAISRRLAVALTDRIPYQAQVDRPKLRLPGGKKLAVWVILNVEEWRIESAMPRTVLSPPMGQPLLPDVPNWSWHQNRNRARFFAGCDTL